MTDKQTDTSTDNKGRLELSGAREPTDRQTDRQTVRQTEVTVAADSVSAIKPPVT